MTISTANKVKSSDITATGNVVGFTSEGYSICAKKSTAKKIFKLYLVSNNDDRATDVFLANKTRTYYANPKQLVTAINNMIDDAKTDELKWW